MKINEIVVVHDDEIGCVWAPEYGQILKTTSKHARLMEEFVCMGEMGKASFSDLKKFESYISSQFKKQPINLVKLQSLMERDSLHRVEIIVATKCNLKCKYCYANEGTYDSEQRVMSSKEAEEYLSALFQMGYKHIGEVMFFGGEPILSPDTIKGVCNYFKLLRDKGEIDELPEYTMVTNGTLIDADVADAIKQNNIRVTISIDGPKEINDVLRVDKNGKGSTEYVEKGIDELVKKNVKIRLIEATYTREHEKTGLTREDVRRYLIERYNPMDVVVVDCDDCEGRGLSELKCLSNPLDNYDSFNKLINSKKKHISYHCDGRPYNDRACYSGYGSITIAPNGDIYPCHLLLGKTEYRMAEYKNGNYSFENYSEAFAKIQQGNRKQNEKCAKCWAKVECEMCPAMLSLGTVREEDCLYEKELQKKAILEMCKKTNV